MIVDERDHPCLAPPPPSTIRAQDLSLASRITHLTINLPLASRKALLLPPPTYTAAPPRVSLQALSHHFSFPCYRTNTNLTRAWKLNLAGHRPIIRPVEL